MRYTAVILAPVIVLAAFAAAGTAETAAPSPIKMAVFSFERQLNGRPAFALEDQEVEFVAQAKKVVLKASFKLAKMMSAGNLDL